MNTNKPQTALKALLIAASVGFILSGAACTANTAQTTSTTAFASSSATQSTSATTARVVPMAMSRSSR